MPSRSSRSRPASRTSLSEPTGSASLAIAIRDLTVSVPAGSATTSAWQRQDAENGARAVPVRDDDLPRRRPERQPRVEAVPGEQRVQPRAVPEDEVYPRDGVVGDAVRSTGDPVVARLDLRRDAADERAAAPRLARLEADADRVAVTAGRGVEGDAVSGGEAARPGQVRHGARRDVRHRGGQRG